MIGGFWGIVGPGDLLRLPAWIKRPGSRLMRFSRSGAVTLAHWQRLRLSAHGSQVAMRCAKDSRDENVQMESADNKKHGAHPSAL